MKTVVLQDPGTKRPVEFKLNFDLYAMASIEEYFNCSIVEALQKLASNTGILTFLWAGLQTEHPNLSRREVGRMVTKENLEHAVKAVADAILESWGNVSEGEPQAQDLGTGTESINTEPL